MERAVALKKLRKLLGDSLGYRVDDKAPAPEERAAALAALPAAAADRKRLSEQKDARMKALLDGDAEYQSLKVAYAAARERADRLLSLSHQFKFTVGTTNSMFFTVRAQGDSWEQIIETLTTEKERTS